MPLNITSPTMGSTPFGANPGPKLPQTQAQAGAPPTTTPSVIPGASTYLAQESQAQQAYEQAQNTLLSNRNSLYHQYGLTSDGSVDPNDQYGQYQTLLGNEGSALDSADQSALDRGLGTGGLAMQGEQSLRQGQGEQNLAFQQQVDQAGQDYAGGLANASEARDTSINQAELSAAIAAANAGQYDIPTAAAVKTASGSPAAKTTAAKTALVKSVVNPSVYKTAAASGTAYAKALAAAKKK